MAIRKRTNKHQFDVCLSFAGEDREFVRKVAEELRNKGVRVFFDEYEQLELWGKDLYEHLDDIYKNAARYCVIFVSRHYAKKVWTNHERRSAQARALQENQEYILPARFDNTPIPGLRETVGYIDLRKHTPQSFADQIRVKIGGPLRLEYLPPVPDRLFEMLGAEAEEDRSKASEIAHVFLFTLKRMSKDERRLLFAFFRFGCPHELPQNVHINVDFLRRITKFAPTKVSRLLGGLSSLGFSTTSREDRETPGSLDTNEMWVLEWHDLTTPGRHGTMIAHAMIWGATRDYCEKHGLVALERLDFSQLASSTAVMDDHIAKPNN
jgi:hypothetical protein